MSRFFEAVLILANTGFIMVLLALAVRHHRTRGQPIGAGLWFFLLTIGAPAAFVFVGTLLGYR